MNNKFSKIINDHTDDILLDKKFGENILILDSSYDPKFFSDMKGEFYKLCYENNVRILRLKIENTFLYKERELYGNHVYYVIQEGGLAQLRFDAKIKNDDDLEKFIRKLKVEDVLKEKPLD